MSENTENTKNENVGKNVWKGKPFEEVLAAANQGDAAALFELGYWYEFGEEDEKDGAPQKDENKARESYEKAALLGYRDAQYETGRCYMNGTGVAEEDYDTAIRWFHLALDQGDEDSYTAIGNCYEEKGDQKTALTWFEEGAKRGNLYAQRREATFYRNGWGVKKDLDKALERYQAIKAAGRINVDDEIKEIWKEQGRCARCGGKFKGLFSKVCSACGWKKDY